MASAAIHSKAMIILQVIHCFCFIVSVRFVLRLFSKWELLLKIRICSQTERILSFKSSSLWYDKSLLPHWVIFLECYYFITHVRNWGLRNECSTNFRLWRKTYISPVRYFSLATVYLLTFLAISMLE